jgi:hypothetical protein
LHEWVSKVTKTVFCSIAPQSSLIRNIRIIRAALRRFNGSTILTSFDFLLPRRQKFSEGKE